VIALNYDTEQWYVKDFIDDGIFPTPSNAAVLGGEVVANAAAGGEVVADMAAEAEE
jgi:hypothetical protein